MANTLTTNILLKKPAFGDANWHDEMWENFDAIDTLITAINNFGDFQGLWLNNTLYTAGQHVFDAVTHDLFRCAVGHTPHASNPFATDRANNPTYWINVDASKQVEVEIEATATRILTAADAGKLIRFTSASAVTVTVPQNSTEALAPGFSCSFLQVGAGAVSFVLEGSDAWEGLGSTYGIAVQGGFATIVKTVYGAPNTWLLAGDIS